MRRFLKNITLFCLPFIILIIILFCIPVNKKNAYDYITNDCYDRSRWFYQRIFENEKPVDVLLLGTSHTICSVRDSVVEMKISSEENHIHILNSGYCRPGISIQYPLLKEVCEHKNPKLIVFEVREQEDRFSHDMFPYTADTKDLFTAPIFYNADYFNDIFAAAKNRFTLIKNEIKNKPSEPDTIFSVYGFWERGETAPSDVLQKQQQEQEKFAAQKMSMLRSFFELHYSEMYVQKMTDLCKEKNIPYLFYYIPSYYDVKGEPVNADFYRSLGNIISPPRSILSEENNWSDEGHLNSKGADAVTDWISEEIKTYLE